MSRWSIHSEGTKFVVRDQDSASDPAPQYPKGDELGKKIGSFSTQRAAADKIRDLEADERHEVRIAAARSLLGS